MKRAALALIAVAVLVPSIAFAQAATPGDAKVSPEPTFVIAKWKARFYGFAELDTMLDSTQSFTEIQGNSIIVKPGLTSNNGRFQETIRNSRLGFSLETPDYGGTRGYGLIEGDFFGFDPNAAYSTPAAGAPASQPSEAGFYTNPTFRIRHAWVKIESPFIDVLGGQTWSVLGGGGAFQPATVALQGINGEIYQRTEQIRVGKTVGFGAGKFEIEVAALRPYQRDVAIPDLSGMLRLQLDGWTGYKSSGGTGGGLSGIQLAVSAVTKQFRAQPAKPASVTDWVTATGTAFAVDAIVPIIPATKESHAGAMTIVAEASSGSGYNDSFTSLNAGIGSPGAPPGAAASYATTIDTGAVGWDSSGKLTPVDYQSLLANLQYYVTNSFFFSGVYSVMASDNSYTFPHGGNGTFVDSKYGSLAAMWDVTPATRVGLEGVWTRQHLSDNSQVRTNRRLNFSMWFYF
ncbi:MAG TPA: hypothetical protein VLW85_04465 [Myxococcales bacterium]|nr:hypothetical protein [Myxococcales bacterium]